MGHTLEVRSTASVQMTIQTVHTNYVVLSDRAAICSTFDCRIGKPGPPGTSLYVATNGTAAQTYSVGSDFTDGGAAASFQVVETNGFASFRDDAVSGSVTISSVNAGVAMSGSYDLTLQSGTVLSGTFSAVPWCDAIRLTSVGDGIVCTPTTGTDSCANTCTCAGKAVSNSCTFDGSMWTCTCHAPSGATSTCSTSMATMACWEYSTCCPFDFKG
jgi:hypothetical protein